MYSSCAKVLTFLHFFNKFDRKADHKMKLSDDCGDPPSTLQSTWGTSASGTSRTDSCNFLLK